MRQLKIFQSEGLVGRMTVILVNFMFSISSNELQVG